MLTIIELINYDSWIRSEKKADIKLECDGQKISNQKIENLDLSMSIMTETHCSYSELRHIDFSNASLGSCQLVDCKFKEGIGIESVNAEGLTLKDSLSDTYLNNAESLRNYINEF